MNPDDIKRIADAIAHDVYPLWLLPLCLLLTILAAYLGSYLAEKGRSAALREDIEDITERVKSIEHTFATQIEELRGRNQLRVAALDRRLETHQQAYTLWLKLLHSVYEPNTAAVVMECQDWWRHNCLYLSPEARESFNRAWSAAADHKHFLSTGIPREDIERNWERIISAGENIVRGVDLPSIGERAIAESMTKKA